MLACFDHASCVTECPYWTRQSESAPIGTRKVHHFRVVHFPSAGVVHFPSAANTYKDRTLRTLFSSSFFYLIENKKIDKERIRVRLLVRVANSLFACFTVVDLTKDFASLNPTKQVLVRLFWRCSPRRTRPKRLSCKVLATGCGLNGWEVAVAVAASLRRVKNTHQDRAPLLQL